MTWHIARINQSIGVLCNRKERPSARGPVGRLVRYLQLQHEKERKGSEWRASAPETWWSSSGAQSRDPGAADGRPGQQKYAQNSGQTPRAEDRRPEQQKDAQNSGQTPRAAAPDTKALHN